MFLMIIISEMCDGFLWVRLPPNGRLNRWMPLWVCDVRIHFGMNGWTFSSCFSGLGLSGWTTTRLECLYYYFVFFFVLWYLTGPGNRTTGAASFFFLFLVRKRGLLWQKISCNYVVLCLCLFWCGLTNLDRGGDHFFTALDWHGAFIAIHRNAWIECFL